MIGADTQLAINDKDHTHPIVTIGEILLITKGKDHNHPIVQSSLNLRSSLTQFLSLGALIGRRA